MISKQTDMKETNKKGKKNAITGLCYVERLPGKRSVDHTRPLLSGVNIAGLHVVTAGVTPHAESRSSLKETHPIGRGGGEAFGEGEGGVEELCLWKREGGRWG